MKLKNPLVVIVLALVFSFTNFTQAQELSKITIKANKIPTKFGHRSTDSQINDVQEIQELQASQAGDLFKNIENVTATSGPRPQAEMPQIRGLDSKRILILIDDARQNLRTTHNGGLIIDPIFLRKVEVISGPSSAIYGSGAIAGVISFETLNPSDLLLKGNKRGFQLQVENHSVQGLNSTSALAYQQQGSYSVLGGFSDKSADNLKLSSGEELKYSSFKSRSALLKLTKQVSPNQQFRVVTSHFTSQSFTPLDPGSTIDSPDFLGNDDRERTSANFQFRSNKKNRWGKYNVTGYLDDSQITKIRQSDQRTELRQTQTLGLDYSQYLDLAQANSLHSLSYGIEYFKDTNNGNRNGGPLPSFPSGTGNFYGGYLQYQKQFGPKFVLTPGIRFDSFTLATTDRTLLDYSDNDTSFRVGSSYLINENNTFFANYAEGFNPPRIQDLYVEGLHFGANFLFPANFFLPNTNLKAERSRSYEAGIKSAYDSLFLNSDLLSFSFTQFFTDVDSYIYKKVDVNAGTTQFINLPSVNLNGLEAAVKYELNQFSSALSFSQVRSFNKFRNQPVSDSPADQITLNLKYKFQQAKIHLGYRGQWAAKQDRVDKDEMLNIEKTASYNIHDLYAGYTFRTLATDDSSLQIRINNILNTNYRVHASIIEAPARDLRLSLKMRF